MNDSPADQQFIEFVVKSMVDYPEEVRVHRTVDELGTLLELTVHPEDTGKVIGKGGQTIKSLRILLRVVGSKDEGNRVNLRLIDNNSLS
jgi:predicted RNA-binding protein YlqC (UPF0109 family)